MCLNPNLRCRPIAETYSDNDNERSIPIGGYYNVKIENTGTVVAHIFNKSLKLMPGIPICIGVENVAMLEDTKLEFEDVAGTKEVKVLKYEVVDINCTDE